MCIVLHLPHQAKDAHCDVWVWGDTADTVVPLLAAQPRALQGCPELGWAGIAKGRLFFSRRCISLQVLHRLLKKKSCFCLAGHGQMADFFFSRRCLCFTVFRTRLLKKKSAFCPVGQLGWAGLPEQKADFFFSRRCSGFGCICMQNYCFARRSDV